MIFGLFFFYYCNTRTLTDYIVSKIPMIMNLIASQGRQLWNFCLCPPYACCMCNILFHVYINVISQVFNKYIVTIPLSNKTIIIEPPKYLKMIYFFSVLFKLKANTILLFQHCMHCQKNAITCLCITRRECLS